MSYLILGVPLLALFWNLYWFVVRPARKRRRAAGTVEPRLPEGFVPPSAALAPPEPKAPRDTSRTYPRPSHSRSKLNRICPVCGMEDPGSLDGKVLGWPAHRLCAEWLGEWRPSRQVPAPDAAKLRAALNDCASSRKVIVLPPGGTVINVKDSPGAQISIGNGNSRHTDDLVSCQNGMTDPVVLIQRGMASVDEVRERLNREIIASWGVPPAILQEHTHKAGDPVPIERCPKCDARFAGPPDYLRMAFEMHRQAGCR
jgi:hypothetical protein